MGEYIDREQAEIMAIDGADKWDGGCNYERELAIQEAIRRIPSADVVEVVRCKDCKWWSGKNYDGCCLKNGLATRYANSYCSDGERKVE